MHRNQSPYFPPGSPWHALNHCSWHVSFQDMIISGLQPETSYSLTVTAYTTKGDGARSKPKLVSTTGAGNVFCAYFYLQPNSKHGCKLWLSFIMIHWEKIDCTQLESIFLWWGGKIYVMSKESKYSIQQVFLNIYMSPLSFIELGI